MAEDEASIVIDADECLHCAIGDNPSAAGELPAGYPAQDYSRLLDRTQAAGVGVVGIRAALIAESLVDVILRVPEGQAKRMAHTLAALGDFFLQKSGADEGSSGSTPH